MSEESSVIDECPSENLSAEQIITQSLSSVAKGGAFVLIGLVSFKLFNFLKQLAIIRLLSPADYGLYALGITVVSVYMVFGGLGLYSGAQRYIAFFHAKGDDARVRGVMVSTLRMLALSTAVFTAASYFLAGPLASLFNKPEMEQVLMWFTALVPMCLAISTMSSFFLGFGRPAFHAFVENTGLSLVGLVVVTIFLLVSRDLGSLLRAQVLSHALIFVLGLFLTLKYLPFRLRGGERVPMGKDLLLFSLPLLAASTLNLIMAWTDTIMLGYYATSDQLAFYNAAFLLASTLPIFLTSVSTVFMPVASGLVARKHDLELRNIYRSTTKWLFLFTLPLFIIFFFFPSQTIGLAFGGDYPTAARALQLLCLGDFVHTFLGPNGMTLLAYGHSRIFMIVSALGAGLNVLLNALLIPRIGITGAATASFIALILVNILISAFLLRRYGIHPFGSSYIKPVTILVAISAALYYPLLMLLDVSRWLLVAYYPLFLAMGIAITYASRSMEPVDRILSAAVRRRLTGAREMGRKKRKADDTP